MTTVNGWGAKSLQKSFSSDLVLHFFLCKHASEFGISSFPVLEEPGQELMVME